MELSPGMHDKREHMLLTVLGTNTESAHYTVDGRDTEAPPNRLVTGIPCRNRCQVRIARIGFATFPPMATRNGSDVRHRYSAPGARWAQAQETHWDYVAQEAARRAGRGPQLKGIIHEMEIGRRLARGRRSGTQTRYVAVRQMASAVKYCNL